MNASSKPATIDSHVNSAVEVGVKFRADSNGYVTGVRFYKANKNIGTHIGHLWTRTGVLLGSATFTNESKSGWQQVNFSKPIAVTANTTYVASYFAPAGHYSQSTNALSRTGIDAPPLHALANGVDGPNGVYLYGSSGGFPTNSYYSTNYWVDVVYTPQAVTANPQLKVSAAALNFGSVTVNSSATQAVTLTSSGTSAVTVNSASVSGAGFSLVGGSLPVTLNPGQSTTLQVQFKPTVAGTVAGQLTISSNSTTGGTAVVSLSGTGAAAASPQLKVSATALSFGSVTVNTSTTQALTLTSSGTSAVTVNSASVSGAGFSLVGGSLPVTLNPGQSTILQVQFKPTVAGSVAGQLTISSNSTTGGTAVVSLSGTGAAAANPQLKLSATALSFGSVAVNSSVTQSVTLTSSGTSAVTVNSALVSGTGFTLVAGTFPATLNPNQSMTLQVQFKPTTTGAAAGKFTITSNSTTGGTAVVSLSGTGTTAGTPKLTVSATSLSFGSVAVDSSATKAVTLTSSGTSFVTVNSASVSGAGFTILGGSFPLTLTPSQTTTLQVQFKPTISGAATGQLTISSNSSSGSTTTLALNGTGTAVPHSVDLSWSAPTGSAHPITGYNVYRAVGSGSFQRVNSTVVTQTVYVDSTVVSGSTYNYVAKSVDSTGMESVSSNQIAVTIP